MNKILTKRILYEVIEDIVHLDAQLSQLEYSVQKSVAPYLKHLKTDLTHLKEQLWAHQSAYLKLFEEDGVSEKDSETIHATFDKVQEKLAVLTQSLFKLSRSQPLPECELFLSSLSFSKLLPDAPRLVLLPNSSSQDFSEEESVVSDTVLLEGIPQLDMESPLRWLGLVKSFLTHFCRKTLAVSSFVDEVNYTGPKENLVLPVLALRLLGPAYYAYFVLDALRTPAGQKTLAIEPMLFQALNHFGFVNKDLVILHQTLEKNKETQNTSKTLAKLLSSNNFTDELFKLAEKIIPTRVAYTEKSFIHAQFLEDRLANGILISAVPMVTSASQLREDISGLDSQDSVYPTLEQLKEFPATPREIINAGWFQKLDESSNWLYDALQFDTDKAFDELKNAICSMDAFLLKSIETAEVHRVLSFDETELLVRSES